MINNILPQERKDILNDIINDKISIKIEKNTDNTFQLGFTDTKTNKVVYDNYKIPYDKEITDLNLATVSLLLVQQLESDKPNRSDNFSVTNNFYNKTQEQEKVSGFSPQDEESGENFSGYKKLEKLLSKIATSYHKLPKLTDADDSKPGVYSFNDGSAIYLKRGVVSGWDGPLDCGPVLFATAKVEKLNEYLVETYTALDKGEGLKEELNDTKTNKFQTAMEFVFGKKDNTILPVISFNTDKMKEMRSKAFAENNKDSVKSLKS